MGFVRRDRYGGQVISPEDLTSQEDVARDTLMGHSRETAAERIARDPEFLAREFSTQLIELADEFDDLNHRHMRGFTGDPNLRKYCDEIRDIARGWPIDNPPPVDGGDA